MSLEYTARQVLISLRQVCTLQASQRQGKCSVNINAKAVNRHAWGVVMSLLGAVILVVVGLAFGDEFVMLVIVKMRSILAVEFGG